MRIRRRMSGNLGTEEIVIARWGYSVQKEGNNIARNGIGAKRWAQPAEIGLVKMFGKVYLERMGMGAVFRDETEGV